MHIYLIVHFICIYHKRIEIVPKGKTGTKKKWASRYCPMLCSIPSVDSKPKHFCWCQEMLAHRILGSWCSCPIKDSVSICLKQRFSPFPLTQSEPTIWLSPGTPMEELGEGWSCWRGLQPHRKNSITNQNAQSSQGLNHQPKSIHGFVHGSHYKVEENCLIWQQGGGQSCLILLWLDASVNGILEEWSRRG